jgi:hypothetical protein
LLVSRAAQTDSSRLLKPGQPKPFIRARRAECRPGKTVATAFGYREGVRSGSRKYS